MEAKEAKKAKTVKMFGAWLTFPTHRYLMNSMKESEEEIRKDIEAMPAYCHSRGDFAQEDEWRKVKFDIVSFEVPVATEALEEEGADTEGSEDGRKGD